jgi:hypothetical protein
MRAAPMDLRTPSQNYSTPRGVEAERTNRMATTEQKRKKDSIRADFDIFNYNSYFLLEGASDIFFFFFFEFKVHTTVLDSQRRQVLSRHK